jgi:hypothetical protein
MAGTANASDFDVGTSSAPATDLSELNRLIREMFEAETMVANLDADLKAAKARFQKLRTFTIPDKMTELGVDALEFGGKRVAIEPFVSGSIPSDPVRKAAAIAWLVENGASDLIKTSVEVEFGKSQHNAALDTAAKLREAGLDPSVSEGVHSQSLCAFARERIKNGDPIDPEVLGLFTGRVAKIKR